MSRAADFENYADQLATARRICEELLTTARRSPDAALGPILESAGRVERSAYLITVARAAAEPNPAVSLAALLAQIDESSWVAPVSSTLLGRRRVGIGSMGETTRLVLEEMTRADRDLPDLVVPTTTIARGLGYLGLPIATGDPAATDAVLIGGVARRDATVWTSASLADLALQAAVRGTRRVPAVHPVALMDSATAGRFRPGPHIVPIEL